MTLFLCNGTPARPRYRSTPSLCPRRHGIRGSGLLGSSRGSRGGDRNATLGEGREAAACSVAARLRPFEFGGRASADRLG